MRLIDWLLLACNATTAVMLTIVVIDKAREERRQRRVEMAVREVWARMSDGSGP